MDCNENLNNRNNSNFLFQMDKIKNIDYWLTDIMVPDITIGRIDFSSPHYMVKYTGTSIEFSDLIITFIVDEEMNTYEKLLKWMLYLNSLSILPENQKNTTSQELTQIINTTLGNALFTFFNNTKNTIIKKIKFYNIWPYGLSSLDLTTRDNEFEIMTCNCSFTYDRFEFLDD